MKFVKYFCIVFYLMFGSFLSTAQVVRTNVIEHFTNTSCSICATRNPSIHNAINSHPGTIHISFHPSVPYPSDFFNKQNKKENDDRTIFYDVFYGTPVVVLNGQEITHNQLPSLLSQPTMTSYSMAIKQTKLVSEAFEISVVIRKESDSNVNKALLFAGVMEDTIQQLTNNGEKVHINVFRKALSHVTGDTIDLPSQIGDSILFNFAFTADPTWNVDNLHTIGILQQFDKSTINGAKSINTEQGTTSVSQNLSNTHQVLVYPNPFIFYVKAYQPMDEVTLFTLSGQALINLGNIRSNDTIDFSELPKGSFLLSGTINHIKHHQVIIKK